MIWSRTYQTARIRPPVPKIGTSECFVGSVEIVLFLKNLKNPVGLYPSLIPKAEVFSDTSCHAIVENTYSHFRLARTQLLM